MNRLERRFALCVGFLVLLNGLPLAQVSGPPLQIPPGAGVLTKGPLGARVFVVDDTPGCRFSGVLQEAIDAADDGDIVLVRPGSYAGGILIDGKRVSVFGEPQGVASPVRVTGTLTIRNLGAEQAVVLRDLELEVTSAACNANLGPIWVERCTWRTQVTLSNPLSSVPVAFFDCDLSGGLLANQATFLGYDSRFFGPDGQNADLTCTGYCSSYDTYWPDCYGTNASSGTTGVFLNNSTRGYLFGCVTRGGRGGAGDDDGPCCFGDPCSSPCQSAGHGVYVHSRAQFTYMELDSAGGATGCPRGLPLSVFGVVTQLLGEVGSYTISGTLRSGASAELTFRGPPGWNVFLTYSDAFEPVYLPDFKGYSVVNPDAPTIFIGSMPLTGELQASIPFNLPANEFAKVLYSQAKLYDPDSGTPYLAAASALLVTREPCP